MTRLLLACAGAFVAEMDVGEKKGADFDRSSGVAGRHGAKGLKTVCRPDDSATKYFLRSHRARSGACGGNLNRLGLGNARELHAAQGEVANEARAAAQGALHFQLGAMALQDVLDDSETQT